jgi:riboflavin transporter FmnP
VNNKVPPSDAKSLAAVAVFAALALTLQVVPLRVPAPYAPFLIYQFWEIPIVIALLLFGPLAAFLVAFINFAGLLVIFPGQLPSGPIYNLIAVISMLIGVLLVHRQFDTLHQPGLAVAATASASVIRVVIMSVVNYLLLPFPPPLGFSIPPSGVVAILPLIGIFNASVTVYTVLIAEFLARGVSVRMQLATSPLRLG